MAISDYDFNPDENFDGINDISVTDKHDVTEEITRKDTNKLSNVETLGGETQQMITMIDALLESNNKLTDFLDSIDDQSGEVSRELTTTNNALNGKSVCSDNQSAVSDLQIIEGGRMVGENEKFEQCPELYPNSNEDSDLLTASKAVAVSRATTHGNKTLTLDEGDQPVQGINLPLINRSFRIIF